MILNEIKAVFGYGRETYTAVQWQYSYGQVLVIENLDLPDTFEAHFSKDYGGGTSKTQIGTNNRVTIPYEYFEQMGNIYCFIFLHEGEDDGETRYCITIPLKSRPKPTDEAPTEHEQTAIEQAIFALNTAVTEANGYADDAEQSANDAQQYAEQAKESAESLDTSVLATKAELANARDELESSIDDVETSLTQLGEDTLHLSDQTLTELQRNKARNNIDVPSQALLQEVANSLANGLTSLENNTVHLNAQTLTNAQKAQARSNIGAVSADDIPEAVSSDRYGSYAYENGDVSAKAVNSYNMSCAVELGTNNTLRHNLNMVLARGVLAMTWVESTSTTDYANGSGDCTQKVQFFVERWSNTLSNHIGSLSDASDCYFSETYDAFTEGDVVYDSNDEVLATIKDASDSTIVATANNTLVIIGMAYCDDINAQRPVAREINVSVTFSADVPTWTVTMSKIKPLTLNGSDFDMRTLRSDYLQKAPQMNNNIVKSGNNYLTTVVQNGVGVALLKSTDCFDWEFVYHVPDKNAHLEASCTGLKYVSNNTPRFLIATRHSYKDGFITIHCMSGENVGATEIDTVKIPASTSRVQFAQTKSTIEYQPYNSYALLCYSLNGRKNGVIARIDSNGEATNAINIVTTEVSNMSNYNVACVSGDVVFYGGTNGLQKEKNGVSICHLLRPSATAMSQAKKNLADIITQGSVATVDSSLSPTSTNPVQNSVIYNAIGDIETLLASI